MLKFLPRLAALALMSFSAAPSFAQAPPPVGALPDSERRQSYSISGTTCACSVGFQLYASGSDIDAWIEVWIGGVRYLSTDSTFGWSLSSITGPLATIPRPITNAVLTFNAVQTGTVQIVGAERPRRLNQFAENRGVAARDLNQALTDILAVEREGWDRTNDVAGRTLRTPPGETIPTLPSAASRALGVLAFDGSGNGVIQPNVPAGSIPVNSITNSLLAQMNANTTKCNNTGGSATPIDCTAAQETTMLGVPTLGGNNTYTGANTFAAGTFTTLGASGVSTLKGDVYFGSGRPWIDVRSGANGCAAAAGNNIADDTTAIQCQLTFAGSSGGAASVVFVPCGDYKVTAQINIPAGVLLVGQGEGCSFINGSASNFQIIHFTGNYSGMIGVFVFGNTTSGATQVAVQIQAGTVGVQIRDSYIWGGTVALQIAGVDCYLQNNFIGAAVVPGGVSLYLHAGVCKVIGNKIDPPAGGGAGSFGIVIDNISSGGAGVVENLLVGNDVSGYTTAVSIDDSADATGRTAITSLVDNVLGSAVSIVSAKLTTITSGELAGNITIGAAGGPVSVSGVIGLSALTASKAICSANINIDCSMTVASLPGCSANYKGTTAFVTDQATAIAYHGAVTGSGAFKQQVVCDGTSWYQG